MNEYSCKILKPFVELFESSGEDLRMIFDDVSFERSHIENQKLWVRWEEVVTIFNAILEQLGSRERFFTEITEKYGVTDNYGFMKALARLIQNPKNFYLKPGVNFIPKYIPVFEIDSEELEDGRIHVMTRLLDGFIGSELYFEVMGVAFSTLPKMIGLPPAEVEYEHSDRHVECFVRCPQSHTLGAKMKLAFATLMNQGAIFDHLGRDGAAMNQQHRELKRLGQELQLLLDQAQNAMLLIEGPSIRYANERAKHFFNLPERLAGNVADLLSESGQSHFTTWLASPEAHQTSCMVSVTNSGSTRKAIAIAQKGLRYDNRPVMVVTLREVTRELELERKLLEAQQDQRNEIAREMHDDLGQQLTAVSLVLASIPEEAVDETVRDQLSTARHTLASSQQSCKSIAMGLSSAAMNPAGLAEGLERMVTSFRLPTDHVVFETDFDVRKDHDVADPFVLEQIYRIAQEAVTNACRHAEASRILIRLEGTEHLKLEISDDGIGYDPRSVRSEGRQGLGLINMERRAYAADLHLTVETSPGNGCRILLS